MNAYRSYQRVDDSGTTRVDLLLSLYDAAIHALERSRESSVRGDSEASRQQVVRARFAVLGLLAGVDLTQGEPATSLARLYEFIVNQLDKGQPEDLTSALGVLQTLRAGVQGIREEAAALERSGQIPPLAERPLLEASA